MWTHLMKPYCKSTPQSLYKHPQSLPFLSYSPIPFLILHQHPNFNKPPNPNHSSLFLGFPLPELANIEASLEAEESNNSAIVRALYDALSAGDVETVQRLLAPDIEWWFHGPPSFQHMMLLLTGASSHESFVFVPLTVTALGSTVLVEGCDLDRSVSWVHAWTVTDGVITQVREYFNTSLTVTRLENPSLQSPSQSSFHCLPVWESKLSDSNGKSMPGLVLAI